MARKSTPKKSPAPVVAKAPVADVAPVTAPVAESAVRKTVAPKAAAPAAAKKTPVPLTHERIAERAYYISQSGTGGSEYDNWMRAEGELKAE